MIKSGHICLIHIWSKMLSLNALIKLSKTSSPQTLFDYESNAVHCSVLKGQGEEECTLYFKRSTSFFSGSVEEGVRYRSSCLMLCLFKSYLIRLGPGSSMFDRQPAYKAPGSRGAKTPESEHMCSCMEQTQLVTHDGGQFTAMLCAKSPLYMTCFLQHPVYDLLSCSTLSLYYDLFSYSTLYMTCFLVSPCILPVFLFHPVYDLFSCSTLYMTCFLVSPCI